ncbi:MAG: hypothetical protein Q8P54_00325 [bacterium]|nr:hypothetical protein [bacterium]
MSAQNEKEKKETLKNLSIQLEMAEASLHAIHKTLDEMGLKPEDLPKHSKTSGSKATTPSKEISGKIIEGIFDGQNMIGPNNKIYPVPANYASKSKLIEGDLLKLTIADDGSFIYKQIGPIERKKLIGKLILEDGQYMVSAGDKNYKVLFASVSYFKANPGEEVTIVIPEGKKANWAAIEAVIS